ncbi:MAG TPA: histidine kinase [Candidatus Limnocylindrales bacterium]|nr:histidine kinase [Candidatus Limnocylindrales bacterium]
MIDPGVAERVRREADDLERELAEIEMLIAQARTEATRYEARRAAAAEKLAGLAADTSLADAGDANAQVVTLTKRAAVMEAQIDVLEGKQKALRRFQASIGRLADELEAATGVEGAGDGTDAAAVEPTPAADHAAGVSRLVLSAQEDLRREIARAMHDGPAQSLTNIVLQAEIVDRLVGRDDAAARDEMKVLAGMVQQTLEATKSFIFDVRPMVLDDLGLVPTLRRAARERGRRAGVPVEFDSVGQDRRLPVDIESGLFRITDEALAAYLERSPERVRIRLEWDEASVDLAVRATREAAGDAPPEEVPEAGKNVPPALAAMIEDRRASQRAAREAAEAAARVVLPDAVAADLIARAAALGASAELLDDGAGLRVRVGDTSQTDS